MAEWLPVFLALGSANSDSRHSEGLEKGDRGAGVFLRGRTASIDGSPGMLLYLVIRHAPGTAGKLLNRGERVGPHGHRTRKKNARAVQVLRGPGGGAIFNGFPDI